MQHKQQRALRYAFTDLSWAKNWFIEINHLINNHWLIITYADVLKLARVGGAC